MIKNNIFEVYDRMDEKELETMAKAFEADIASTIKQYTCMQLL